MDFDLVVVAAFPPELAPYVPDDAGRVDLAGIPARAAAVGVGLVAAAIGAAEIARSRPSLVVFSGTCGAYPGGPAVLEVIVGRRVHLMLPLVLEGRGRFPAAVALPREAPVDVVAALVAAGATAVDVATTPAITTDDALAARVGAASGCAVEHLEAYAVAAACAVHDVPFVAVLGVANAVGATAHDEWRRNHHEASLRASRIVRGAARALRSGR